MTNFSLLFSYCEIVLKTRIKTSNSNRKNSTHSPNAIPEKNVPNYLLRENGSNFHLGRQVLLSPRSPCAFFCFVSSFMQKMYIFAPFHKAWEGRQNLPIVCIKQRNLSFFHFIQQEKKFGNRRQKIRLAYLECWL